VAASAGLAAGICRRALVERHDDVAADLLLDSHHAFRRQPVFGAVDVRAKRSAAVIDPPQTAEAEDLKAAAIGEDRTRPNP